jgi:hypothetical protein
MSVIFRFLPFCTLLTHCFVVSFSWSYANNQDNLAKQADYSLKIIQYVDNWNQIINKDELFFCVSGSNEFAQILTDNLINYKFKYKIKVIVNPVIDNIYQCKIFYIKKSYPYIKELLAKTYNHNILTISEDEMVWYNTIISFYFIRGSIRFFVNYDALEKSSIILSAKLLTLANLINID